MLNEVDPAANRTTANGATTVFPYTFEITLKTDIEVLVDLVVKTVDVDYTVDGLGNSGGGNVTFFAAPANLSIVTRLRKQPASQLSVYTPNEGFPHERVMVDLDKLAMQIQQIKEQLHRGFFLPKSSALSDQGVDVPTVGAFARGKSGGGIDWATPTNAGPLSSPVAIADGGTGATTAAAARTNLGITALGEVLDTDLRVIGNLDNTKKLAFQVDGFTTGNTRTFTHPDADLTLPAVTAAGDIPIASASGVLSKIAVGAAGTIPISRAASSLKVAYVPALFGSRYGHTYAHGDGAGGGDQTNDWTFTAGGCMDVTGAYWIQTVALTKQADVAWAVGTAAGLLDTGAVGNSDYYLFVIARSDTGVTDYLMSLSPTAPTMPANYDFKRLIGWFKRVAGVNVLLKTYETEGGGLQVLWDSPTLDINLANTLTTSRRTDAVKVPLNFSVIAALNVVINDTSGNWHTIIYCPDMPDLAPSVSAAPLATIGVSVSAGSSIIGNIFVRTSATGTIAARSVVALMDLYAVTTLGFTWARRN